MRTLIISTWKINGDPILEQIRKIEPETANVPLGDKPVNQWRRISIELCEPGPRSVREYRTPRIAANRKRVRLFAE